MYQKVCHDIHPDRIRHIALENEQAAIPLPCSTDLGGVTESGAFIPQMSGENQDYTDMKTPDIWRPE